MRTLIQSHKTLFLCMYISLALGFILKLGLEMKHHKSVQLQEYSGSRLK